jgi:hypothetical protein
MNLSENINLPRTIMNLFDGDLEILNDKKVYDLDEVSFHELKEAALSNDLNAILLIIDRLFKQAVADQNSDHTIFLSYFLYRYIYFFRTVTDWEKFVVGKDEIKMADLGSMFLDNVAPFFDHQINFFINNYSDYIEQLEVKTMSTVLYNEINELVLGIKKSQEFDHKLMAVEELVRYFQDSRNLVSLLEGDMSEAKEVFLTVTNEIKVDFQSMNNLISQILKKIKEMRVE